MFLNVNVSLRVIFDILNFPVHHHNFHVPECPCDEDAPEYENDLTATDCS